MIHANTLTKDYGKTKALRGVSIDIPDNQVVGLLGPNGAGKTTLMKILTGFIHPTSGGASIDGIDVVERPIDVQKRIGYLPENAPSYPDMLVQEYLEMMAELREVPESDRKKLIGDAAAKTGLLSHLVRPIGQLSKGYRQRVGLAQAILHQPKVLILDEPTTGLDPSQIVEIRSLIKALAENATVLLSTHILPEVELTCERVLIISEGQLRTDEKLEDLHSSKSAIVAVPSSAKDAASILKQIEGVKDVSPADDRPTNGYAYLRVSGEHQELCPAIFDVAKAQNWRLAELKPDQRDLESVFRRIVEGVEA